MPTRGCTLSWLQQVRAKARARIAVARSAALHAPAEPGEAARVLMVEPTHQSVDEDVPRGVRIAAAWAWRLIVLGAAAYLLFRALGILRLVVIPVVISLLLAALLSPGVGWLRRVGVPRGLSVVIVVITGLASVAGVLTVVIRAFVDGVSDLTAQVTAGIDQVRAYLVQYFSVSQAEIDNAFKQATKAITDNQGALTSGALDTATTLGHILAGFFLMLFTTFFFLKDGRRIWYFLIQLLPRGARQPMNEAGEQAWRTLIAYVRATVLVAFVDALGIGLSLAALRVPLALPLSALVFMSAFVPVVGATLSGAVAVLVALVTVGPVKALLVLAAVIAVQQVEGHVLQPLLLGRAVALHPLGVIVALAGGVVLGGVVGALIAVPLVAVLNTGVRALAAYHDGLAPPSTAPPPPAAPPPVPTPPTPTPRTPKRARIRPPRS